MVSRVAAIWVRAARQVAEMTLVGAVCCGSIVPMSFYPAHRCARVALPFLFLFLGPWAAPGRNMSSLRICAGLGRGAQPAPSPPDGLVRRRCEGGGAPRLSSGAESFANGFSRDDCSVGNCRISDSSYGASLENTSSVMLLKRASQVDFASRGLGAFSG